MCIFIINSKYPAIRANINVSINRMHTTRVSLMHFRMYIYILLSAVVNSKSAPFFTAVSFINRLFISFYKITIVAFIYFLLSSRQ